MLEDSGSTSPDCTFESACSKQRNAEAETFVRSFSTGQARANGRAAACVVGAPVALVTHDSPGESSGQHREEQRRSARTRLICVDYHTVVSPLVVAGWRVVRGLLSVVGAGVGVANICVMRIVASISSRQLLLRASKQAAAQHQGVCVRAGRISRRAAARAGRAG